MKDKLYGHGLQTRASQTAYRILARAGEGNIKVYPNPFNNQLTINYTLMPNSNGRLVLLDLLGREQANISLHSSLNNVTVNLPTLSNGIYVYKYMVDGIVISTGKLIKE